MDENKKKILDDPDFINIRRFDYSLERLLDRYPDGASDRLIASALMMTEDEVSEFYEEVVEKLRTIIGVNHETKDRAT